MFLIFMGLFVNDDKTIFCVQICFNNPIETYFSNKKYLITIQTRPTQIVKLYFLLKNRVLTDFYRLLVLKMNYLSPLVQI